MNLAVSSTSSSRPKSFANTDRFPGVFWTQIDFIAVHRVLEQEGKVSRAAKSIVFFGVYLLVAGLGFLLIPNLPLSIFGLPTTTEVWIRVVGLVVAAVGGYYLYLGRLNDTSFFRVTVPGRFAVAAGLLVFVLLDLVGPQLLLFAVLDSAGAIWTWLSLRKVSESKYSPA
jgi:hypothetical protein